MFKPTDSNQKYFIVWKSKFYCYLSMKIMHTVGWVFCDTCNPEQREEISGVCHRKPPNYTIKAKHVDPEQVPSCGRYITR